MASIGPGVDLHRLAGLHQPHAHVETVGAGDDHRGQVGALTGLAERGIGDHPVHEGPGDDAGHLTDLTVPQPLLHGLEAAAEPLGVTHDRIDPRRLDGLEHSGRIHRVGGQGLFDEERLAQLNGGEDRRHVLVLGGGDDHGRHLGSAQQLVQIGRDQIGVDVFAQGLGDVGVDVAEPDPVNRRMLPGQDGADAAHCATADDSETDALPSHRSIPRRRAAFPPTIRSTSWGSRPLTLLMRPSGSVSPMSYG